MIEVKKEGVLFTMTDLEFENEGVFNPAVMREGDSVHLFYRAVREGNHSSIGYCRLDGPLTLAERWDKPFMIPEFEYELHGNVDNIVFPTGTALFGNTLFIYYGAADTHVACASISLSALTAESLSYTAKDGK